jgi:hypothetical protein
LLANEDRPLSLSARQAARTTRAEPRLGRIRTLTSAMRARHEFLGCLLTLSRHGRIWGALPFKTPNVALPQILDKVGSKADKTGSLGVPN